MEARLAGAKPGDRKKYMKYILYSCFSHTNSWTPNPADNTLPKCGGKDFVNHTVRIFFLLLNFSLHVNNFMNYLKLFKLFKIIFKNTIP